MRQLGWLHSTVNILNATESITVFFLIFIYLFGCARPYLWHVGSFPDQGWNSGLLQSEL